MTENLKLLWSFGLMLGLFAYFQQAGLKHLTKLAGWFKAKISGLVLSVYLIHREVWRLRKLQAWRKRFDALRCPMIKSSRTITFTILLMLLAVPAFSADKYFASASAGANNGTSCANAYAYTDATNGRGTANAETAGNILHLCGSFSISSGGTFWTFGHSGSAGNPITMIWETGATITSVAMNIGIDGNSHAYLIFDGNCSRPCATSSIIDTDNGKSLGHQIDSNGIHARNCTSCEAKNLTITGMFVQVKPAGASQGIGSGIVMDGDNIAVHDNWITDAYIGVVVSYPYDNGANADIYNNYFNHINWGSFITADTATWNFSGLKWHSNTVGDLDNWDNPGFEYHHNGVFIVQNNDSAAITNTQVYDNLFAGKQGDTTTAWIFFNTGINGMYVFNNVFNTDPDSGGYIIRDVADSGADSNIVIINNTITCGGIAAIALDNTYSGVIIKNNAVLDTCYSIIFTHTVGSGWAVDYNAYPSTTTTVSGHVMKVQNDGGQSWAEYQSAWPAFDVSGHTLLPADFKLTGWTPNSDSPLIAAGTDFTATYCGSFPEICNDASGAARPNGSAWTIGAYNAADGGGGASGVTLIGTMAMILMAMFLLPIFKDKSSVTVQPVFERVLK